MDWPYLVLVTLFGACVGSFLNVVIYRLPEGQSLIRPSSHCPSCNTSLKWYDNLPVVGWLLLRGRCRYCGVHISVQYPLIEALTAGLFALVFVIYYMTPWRPVFGAMGLAETWPVLIVHLVLIAGLIACTVIDARLLIIPLQVTWWIVAAAVVIYPVAVLLGFDATHEAPIHPLGFGFDSDGPLRHAAELRVAQSLGRYAPVIISPYPIVGLTWAGAALLGVAGLIMANVLLWLKVLPLSFPELEEEEEADGPANGESSEPIAAAIDEPADQADAADPPADSDESDAPDGADEDPHAWLDYPHPRREAMKELAFLAFPIAGLILGWWAFSGGEDREPVGRLADAWRVLGGVMLGYLVGGGLVWAVRVLGTLGFGKEAMGLGDVHLMAAVGAVCGWRVAVLAFLVAPFFGLGYAAVTWGLRAILHREVKVIPYGPHLAIATVLVMLLRDPLLRYFGPMMGL